MSLSKMAAALSLAGLGAGGGMAGGKDLTCGVCREVYRSPRFLPCFHTFCQYCVEGLSRAHHDQPFPCPTCRKPTVLPPDGSLGLQVNQYITPEELQRARESPGTTPCRRGPGHDGQVLLLYCKRCEEALCVVCKMTEHENHPTSSLVEVAARCQRQLGEMQGPLEETIRCLTGRSALVNDSVQAAQAEGERVMEQINAQCDLLVAKAYTWRDVVSAEVGQYNLKMKDKLSADAVKVQRELDALMQLGQRVQRAMGDASSVAETVEVEREMRKGRGNKENLQGVKAAVLHTTVRPSLNFNPAALADDVIWDLLGSPREVIVPLGFREVLVPVYQCNQEEEGDSRRVCHLLPGYDEKNLSEKGTIKGTALKNGDRFFFMKSLTPNDSTNMRVLVRVTKIERRYLYVRFQGGNLHWYKPPNIDFHPTAACFWSERGEDKLLVADAGNDSLHVVRLGRDDVCFERFLAPGDVHLINPTALSVDDEGRVWVGCADGWILRCDITRGNAEPRAGGGHNLGAEYCSRSSNHPSGVDSASVAAVRVDNDSQSDVDSASVAAVRVENDSQSGVDSASVADLRVENDSQSGVDSASVATLRMENGSQSGVESASAVALRMENGSQSGVESASAVALRMENGSQSGVESASAVALRMENGSQSGVESASVAALDVENDSQSDVENASMAALGVENNSQSGVHSASIAALDVDNGSQSGVDSAAVAALRMENDSQSDVENAPMTALRVENNSQSGVHSASVSALDLLRAAATLVSAVSSIAIGRAKRS